MIKPPQHFNTGKMEMREKRNNIRKEIKYIEGFLERYELSKSSKAEIYNKLMRLHGLLIEPERADYIRRHVNVVDPYGILGDCDEFCVGKIGFARNPGGPWVCGSDIPANVWRQICSNSYVERHELHTHSTQEGCSIKYPPVTIFSPETEIPF